MTLLDKNELVSGKFPENEETVTKKLPVATPANLIQFRQLLAVNEIYGEMLKQTESPNEFYAACSMFAKTLESCAEAADVFFAAKLGYTVDNVPAKLVYLLNKAKEQYKYPNVVISAIDWTTLKYFLRKGALVETTTVASVMSMIFGYNVNLLNKYRRRVSNGGVFEYYVENTDRVLVLPASMATKISSDEDLATLEYVRGVGVCVRGEPIRALFGKFGITMDEYDLEGCV